LPISSPAATGRGTRQQKELTNGINQNTSVNSYRGARTSAGPGTENTGWESADCWSSADDSSSTPTVRVQNNSHKPSFNNKHVLDLQRSAVTKAYYADSNPEIFSTTRESLDLNIYETLPGSKEEARRLAVSEVSSSPSPFDDIYKGRHLKAKSYVEWSEWQFLNTSMLTSIFFSFFAMNACISCNDLINQRKDHLHGRL
jgi:hypothetical protein